MFRNIVAALVATLAQTAPVYGTYPGWVVGNGKANINVQVAIDLVCTDCMAANPIWNEVLQTSWLDSTVQDQVFWGYSPFPLPYHVHTFQVTQVVPYL